MVTRLRTTWLASGAALVMILAISGIAAGATVVGDSAPVVDSVEPLEGDTDTTLTFEDLDGNGIDDDCQDAEAVQDDAAVLAALTAADLNGDGILSVSEAAQTDWTGGPNCNHGGYVSGVARGSDCDEDAADETPDEGAPEGTEAGFDEDGADESEVSEAVESETTCDEDAEEADDAAPTTCEAAPEEPADEEGPVEETPEDTAPNAHGKAVSAVAQDKTAIGGKNCNHGGAVSEAAKKDHGPKQAHTKVAGAHGKGHHGHGKPQ